MKRISTGVRPDHIEKLEKLSFGFHTMNGDVYWDESAHYEFDMTQVNQLEKATNDLYEMCLTAVQHVIDNNLFEQLHINPDLIPLIVRSWDEDEPSIYGRFDFGYDGVNPPKMLEFNADTPTSLYEASVVQWEWLQDIDKDKDKDQFNSIHEKLIAYWEDTAEYFEGETVHFSCIDTIEDYTTTEYMRDTAFQAGIKTKFIKVDEIGWDENSREFVDNDDEVIHNMFKLYPWEWLIEEEFGFNILLDRQASKWIEPAWKSILSNKGILPILWKLFPNHPNLLPTYFDNPNGMLDYVKKPIYSREGANVTIFKNGVQEIAVDGDYGEEGHIYQKYYALPQFDGNYPVIGSWVIAGESAGIGIRESKIEVTDNMSRFIPHFIN